MTDSRKVQVDLKDAYESYLARFEHRFGSKPLASFVKFNRTMVQKLGLGDFPGRLDAYLRAHIACKTMLEAGSTISDAVVLDFEEAAAWLAIEIPDIKVLFKGEVGDPHAEVRKRADTTTKQRTQ